MKTAKNIEKVHLSLKNSQVVLKDSINNLLESQDVQVKWIEGQ